MVNKVCALRASAGKKATLDSRLFQLTRSPGLGGFKGKRSVLGSVGKKGGGGGGARTSENNRR